MVWCVLINPSSLATAPIVEAGVVEADAARSSSKGWTGVGSPSYSSVRRLARLLFLEVLSASTIWIDKFLILLLPLELLGLFSVTKESLVPDAAQEDDSSVGREAEGTEDREGDPMEEKDANWSDAADAGGGITTCENLDEDMEDVLDCDRWWDDRPLGEEAGEDARDGIEMGDDVVLILLLLSLLLLVRSTDRGERRGEGGNEGEWRDREEGKERESVGEEGGIENEAVLSIRLGDIPRS